MSRAQWRRVALWLEMLKIGATGALFAYSSSTKLFKSIKFKALAAIKKGTALGQAVALHHQSYQ